MVVRLVLQGSQENGVRGENRALRDRLYQVAQDGRGIRGILVHQAPPDLQAFPPTPTASLERPGLLVVRVIEVTKERWAKKVRK